jgi:hypothetical protein
MVADRLGISLNPVDQWSKAERSFANTEKISRIWLTAQGNCPISNICA